MLQLAFQWNASSYLVCWVAFHWDQRILVGRPRAKSHSGIIIHVLQVVSASIYPVYH